MLQRLFLAVSHGIERCRTGTGRRALNEAHWRGRSERHQCLDRANWRGRALHWAAV